MHLRKLIYCLVLLEFFWIQGSCAKDYVTGKSSYNWYKIDQDVALGKEVLHSQMRALTAGSYKGQPIEVDVDQEQLYRLRGIVDRVTKVSHLPDLPYEVHLAEVPVPNAWAAPGGKIMVFSGLWDPKEGLVEKDNDDEIAAVLSHEIAHATARHVTETISTHMTILLAGTVAQSAIGAAGSQMGSNLFGQFFSYGFNIYAPTYSRKNEAEADRIGLFYMAKAGYDPQAAVIVWKRAAQKKGDMSTIYASHPSSGERAKTLEKYLPQAMVIYRNPEKPYPDFAKMNKVEKEKTKKKSPETQPHSTPKPTPLPQPSPAPSPNPN